MVSIYTAPLRAALACALLSAIVSVHTLAAAQANTANSANSANVADPRATVPPARYAPAFTYHADATPAAAPVPDMAMHGMQMPAPVDPPATPHQHHAGMAMPPPAAPQSMPPSMPHSMHMEEHK